MSLIQQFRDHVKDYEGFAEAWIVSKGMAIATHVIAALIGGIIGWKLH